MTVIASTSFSLKQASGQEDVFAKSRGKLNEGLGMKQCEQTN